MCVFVCSGGCQYLDWVTMLVLSCGQCGWLPAPLKYVGELFPELWSEEMATLLSSVWQTVRVSLFGMCVFVYLSICVCEWVNFDLDCFVIGPEKFQ